MRQLTSIILVLAGSALAGSAAAQSSVTVFGVADAAVRRASTSGAGSITSLVSGAYSSSRFGFRGQEDLGGGLSASFWLESFLSTDSGTTTPVGFQRRSTVSLTHTDFGELRLGRDYTPTHSNWSRFDPFNYVGIGAVQLLALGASGSTPATAAFGTAPNTIQRANNGIQLLLPRNAWGLDGGVVFGFRENGTAANDQHKISGGRLGVTAGKLYVSAAMMKTRDDLTGPDSFDDAAVGAAYDAGLVKMVAGVRRFEFRSAKQTNLLLGATMPIGLHEIKASWNRADFDGRVGTTAIDANRADQFAVGYVYNFSKRTRFYATYATMRNKAGSRFAIPGAPAAATGASSRGLESGLNQEF